MVQQTSCSYVIVQYMIMQQKVDIQLGVWYNVCMMENQKGGSQWQR